MKRKQAIKLFSSVKKIIDNSVERGNPEVLCDLMLDNNLCRTVKCEECPFCGENDAEMFGKAIDAVRGPKGLKGLKEKDLKKSIKASKESIKASQASVQASNMFIAVQ